MAEAEAEVEVEKRKAKNVEGNIFSSKLKLKNSWEISSSNTNIMLKCWRK